MGFYYLSAVISSNNSLKKGINMFSYYINQYVDAVQTAKKNWVDKSVQDTDLAKHMHKFVETQREYTKAAVNNFESFGIGFAGYSANKIIESTKKATERVKKFAPKA
jgi:hypothetical protein